MMRHYPFLLILLGAWQLHAAAGCKTDCADLTVEECASSECDVLHGSKIVSGCSEKRSPAACREREMPCALALMIGRDPTGVEWLLPDLCTPKGWTFVRSDDLPEPCE